MVATCEVTYDVDGLTMVGHLARPDDEGPWPTVLIGHDGIGLDDVQRRRADHLAEQGCLALALDYHGGQYFGGRPEAMLARTLPLIADPGRLREIGRAALQELLAVPGADPHRLAALGWGAGGTLVLELARDGVPFHGIAVVHPAFPHDTTAQDWAAVAGPVLLCTGSEDPLCTPDQVLSFSRVLQEAGVDWRAHLYGGAEHAFWAAPTDPDGAPTGGTSHTRPTVPGVSHHPAHTARAWRAVLDLLTETVGPWSGGAAGGRAAVHVRRTAP